MSDKMTRETELETIKSVLSGCIDDFEVLVHEYEKPVYNLALRMTGSIEDAQDLTQETFIKAYRRLDSFRGDSKFSSWLYRIASNVCLDHLRAKSRTGTVSISLEDEDGEESELCIRDPAPSVEDSVLGTLTREAVQRGLDVLPEAQRQILLLREISGLSYDEIAQALSLESGTVKSRIFRARKKLCKFLLSDGNIPDELASKHSKEVADK